MNAYTKNNLIRFAALFFLTSFGIYSCKKDGKIGLDVQPITDLISSEFKDTSTVLSYVQKDDSVKTNNSSLLFLGSYVDPVFGKTSCSFFTQLNIFNNSNNIDFTNGIGPSSELVLDSAVLTLQYRTTSTDGRKLYGSSADQQTINVYELTQGLTLDSTYYSNRMLSYSTLIGSQKLSLFPDSNVLLKGVKVLPHLRIKIDSTFAAGILMQSGTANLADNTAFHNYFKGIYVAPSNVTQAVGEGAVFYFDPHGTYTKLTLYYRRHVSSPAAGDTINYSFEINGTTAYFNNFQHDYTSTAVDTRINNGINDTDYIYVQSAAGIRTRLTLPYLKNWTSKGPIAVNKAEVVFKVDGPTVTTNYNAHPKLFLVAIDSVPGKFDFPIDFYELASAYGGDYNATTQEYRFNIARHVQSILDGRKTDHGFYLLAAGGAVNAGRTVLYGSSKISNKLKFRLTYTKLY